MLFNAITLGNGDIDGKFSFGVSFELNAGTNSTASVKDVRYYDYVFAKPWTSNSNLTPIISMFVLLDVKHGIKTIIRDGKSITSGLSGANGTFVDALPQKASNVLRLYNFLEYPVYGVCFNLV